MQSFLHARTGFFRKLLTAISKLKISLYLLFPTCWIQQRYFWGRSFWSKPKSDYLLLHLWYWNCYKSWKQKIHESLLWKIQINCLQGKLFKYFCYNLQTFICNFFTPIQRWEKFLRWWSTFQNTRRVFLKKEFLVRTDSDDKILHPWCGGTYGGIKIMKESILCSSKLKERFFKEVNRVKGWHIWDRAESLIFWHLIISGYWVFFMWEFTCENQGKFLLESRSFQDFSSKSQDLDLKCSHF